MDDESKPIVDKINEEQALERAAEEGIEFVDTFTIDGDEDEIVYDTREDAEEAAKPGDNIIQTRRRK